MVNFRMLEKLCETLRHELENDGVSQKALRRLEEIDTAVAQLCAAERGAETKEALPEVLFKRFKKTLDDHKISSGTIGEIGGAKNSLMHRLAAFEIRFLSLFPSADPRMLVADITNCPHIPDASFDAIYSISVLEHVTRIHDAAREIVRLLKPGGISAHAVPFSYFFHGAPVDYWRVTTSALESLFDELETIECFFYSENRRRNNVGSPQNPIGRDGGPQFATDAFGGWRENWFTVYIGRKPLDSGKLLLERRRDQALIDIIKGLKDRKVSEPAVILEARRLIAHLSFGDHGRIAVSANAEKESGEIPEASEIEYLWKKRRKGTLRPSADRHNLIAMLVAAGLVT